MKSIHAAVLSVLMLCCLEWPAQATTTTFPTKLFLQFDGVALSSFPGKNKLNQVVQVDRTQGTTPVTWTATSNEPWLSVTASGQTGHNLTVTADPGQVSGTGFQLGQITVSTSGGDFTDTETIRVGFYVGTTKPKVVTLQAPVAYIATNPVEPLAYVSDETGSVSVYNVYDGTFVTKFTHIAPSVGPMEVSSDGLTLFVTDLTNFKIIALNADTGALIGRYKVGYAINSEFNLVYARPFGQPAIYPQGGHVIAFPSGEKLTSALPQGQTIAVTRDGQKVFGIVYGEDPGTLTSYSVMLKNDALVLTHKKNKWANGDNCSDIAVSLNGKHVYPACAAPSEFEVYDDNLHQVQTLATAPYPNNIEIDSNDDVVGGLNGLNDEKDVYVYSQSGFTKGRVSTTSQSRADGQLDGSMKVSGDSTRVVSATDPAPGKIATLMFRNLPRK